MLSSVAPLKRKEKKELLEKVRKRQVPGKAIEVEREYKQAWREKVRGSDG